MSSQWLEERMKSILDRRAQKGSLRVYLEEDKAEQSKPGMDFSSNDYLGLARDTLQQQAVEQRYQDLLSGTEKSPTLGSTGSRLLSGDSSYARQLERRLAQWHNRPAALLFNSGYDANVAVLSCIPCDHFVFDEYSHNSLQMGMRLSSRRSAKKDGGEDHLLSKQHVSFQHNNVDDMRQKLRFIQRQSKSIVIDRKR